MTRPTVADIPRLLRQLADAFEAADADSVQQPTQSLFLTVADYARRHSISQGTVRSAIREGVLPARRIGRALRIPATAEIGKPARNATSDATARARLKLLGGGSVR
jgi:excisionase family DNA binding protein